MRAFTFIPGRNSANLTTMAGRLCQIVRPDKQSFIRTAS